ncbi:Nif3-like dinuclear metal center hexameric protein [Carboxydothermus pertinax]|uniref:GTP cyclohydrolase 1 type 2 homolog n=1 Tax=Carboxydothermus pertinax TaxID=870242 RepID=A0A1L8CWN4_9THEO|nr:Nif3-like dinuclear metal center hexameric protein [Carboxydothermus pertinax]GAV23336.1 Nif3-like dinuclear metal center hexameric protein [Carboxydothermus pertinax]
MAHPQEIASVIEKKFPRKLAAEWDNPGWQIYFEREVTKILLALDITSDTVALALREGVDLIITHHPLFFKPLNSLTFDKAESLPLLKLLENKILVYSIHTNLDIAKDGLNDYLAELLELSEIRPLGEEVYEKLYKLSVFVPESHWEIVREAMGAAGAGFIGNYSHCTFNTRGTGTFLPLEGASPFIGEVGRIEKVEEVKVETIVPEKLLNRVLKAMLKVHPYEEVAYDIYPLENKQYLGGMGRIGVTKKKSFKELLAFVAERLELKNLRYGGNLDSFSRKVAIVSGAGGNYWQKAKFAGADVFITGDIKYHEAVAMLDAGLNFIDAGHWETEKIFYQLIVPLLQKVKGLKWIMEKREPVFNYLVNFGG